MNNVTHCWAQQAKRAPVIKRGLMLGFIACLVGCVSNTPQTSYYSLFAAKAEELPLTESAPARNISIGIGPMRLPEFMDNPAIVSLTSSQQIKVSGYHAWGGDLKSSIGRAMSTNLSALWQHDGVVAFPWDSRTRPEYQVRIVFGEFSGVRGGDVRISASWLLIDTAKGEVVKHGREVIVRASASASVNDYIKALNELVTAFSITLAEKAVP
ncbi:PqiC family protein [Teredinibacter purpureus]|uniref:PqiC family protein n=1 Tax=Teredinibacter purpureus TaxID=2731756 RepID=UPI0005F88608|nr:PqiC family protein [Teredinibacter purpureus]